MLINKTYLIRAIIFTVSVFALPVAAQAQDPGVGKEVFLKIKAPLDEARGLCVDIPGHKARVNVKRSLVVHTCKWTIWNFDERFDQTAFRKGHLRMSRYNLCVGVNSKEAKAEIVLAACDGDPQRRWNFVEGRLQLAAAPEMCLTIGPEPSELTPGGRRLPSKNVARSLALDTCSEKASDRQIWHPAALKNQ
ncbi:MAG: hypothetical protein HOB79_10880 [Rhodospirillaceae bacterium]|nr:hypothetical protein [Rhodospirillaceae bacterium]